MGVLLSSAGAGWQGLTAELISLPPGSLSREPDPDHRVSIHLGRPHRLWEWRDGQTREGPHRHGDVVIAAGGEARRVRWDKPTLFLSLRLEAAQVAGAAESLGLNPDTARVVGAFSARDAQLEHLGLALLRELEAGAPSGPLFGDALASALATRLLARDQPDRVAARRPRGGLAPRALRRVMELVHERLEGPLPLADLAEAAGCSPYHFVRQFRLAVGVPPHQYVIRARVEEAQRLLLAGESPATAASRTGFSSQSHLTRHMRRLLGVTPGALARPRQR